MNPDRGVVTMSPKDEHPARSETRIVTERDEKVRIEFALNQAESHLARMQSSPATRRLKLALEVFRRTVTSWSIRTPTREELDLIREHVHEVLELVKSDLPTVKLPRSA
jgi:transposase InsO family protein